MLRCWVKCVPEVDGVNGMTDLAVLCTTSAGKSGHNSCSRERYSNTDSSSEIQEAHRYSHHSHSLGYLQDTWELTCALAQLPVAPPEDSDKGGSVVSSRLDVVVLSEEDVVAVFHAAETGERDKRWNTTQHNTTGGGVGGIARAHTHTRHNLLLGEIADDSKLSVFLLVLQQLSHCVTQVKQHAAVRWDRDRRTVHSEAQERW